MSIKNGRPDGYHSVTPHLVVATASDAIAFYQRAFGAEELGRLYGPGDLILHADLKIGDSIVWIAEENPAMGMRGPKSIGGSASSLALFVTDVDSAVDRAVKAGATVLMPPMDMFWGARFARVTDPYGHQWSFATQKREVSPEELDTALKAMGGGLKPTGKK